MMRIKKNIIGASLCCMQLGTHLKSAPDKTLEIFFFWGGGDVLGTLQDVFKRAQNISKHFHRYDCVTLKYCYTSKIKHLLCLT